MTEAALEDLKEIIEVVTDNAAGIGTLTAEAIAHELIAAGFKRAAK